MKSVSLGKYYTTAVFIPGLIIVLGYIIFIVFDELFGEVYKSEWLTKGGVNFTGILIVIANTIFVFILTTPIFLNMQPKVSMNIAFSFLSWFLVPMSWFAYLFASHYHYMTRFSHKLDSESLFIFSNTLPYIVGLAWAFIRFRKELNVN